MSVWCTKEKIRLWQQGLSTQIKNFPIIRANKKSTGKLQNNNDSINKNRYELLDLLGTISI